MDKKEKSKKTENIENTTNNTLTRKRLLILMAVFIFIAMIIAGYTGYIQFVWANELKVKSYEQQNQDRTIKASRGTIYDSQGRILAISISVDTISASPVILQKNKNITVEEIAQELCLILKLNYESVLTKLMSQSQYQLIASKVDKNTSELVKEFIKKQAVAGIYIQQDSKRYYPLVSCCSCYWIYR
jgi:stage V sporulation protein D (sporulation-specific penicillin-binding protein)